MTEDVKKGLAALILFATLLTGCSSSNANKVKSKNDNYTKVAIMINDNVATIIDTGYFYTSGGHAVFEYPDGSRIITSNAIIVEGFEDYSEVEEFVRTMIGEDGVINYYSRDKAYTRKR